VLVRVGVDVHFYLRVCKYVYIYIYIYMYYTGGYAVKGGMEVCVYVRVCWCVLV